MSIEKQIKVRAEAEQIVQHENTSDRIGSMLQLQALAASCPHIQALSLYFLPQLHPKKGWGWQGAKTCDTLKCSEASPPGGKSGKMFPHVGEQLSVQWDTVHSYWSIAFCSACIWYHLLRGSKTFNKGLYKNYVTGKDQTPLGMDWKCHA